MQPVASTKEARGRMLHIRLDPGLHRTLRMIVAAQDTTLQEWVVRTLASAASAAEAEALRPKPEAG